MIEEEAFVAEVEEGAVWVVKSRSSGCSGCSEPCPSSLSSRFFVEKQFRLRVSSNFPLQRGDKILLGIEDECLARVSFGIYLLPLLSFFLSAMAGVHFFGSDMAGVLGGLSGLGLCLAGFKYFKLFERYNCHPVVLRKIN
jgi:positive regulator of sigma E activity